MTTRGEQGQMLVMAALTFTVVVAFSALAIDVGFFLQTRTKLQADVDALSLGGAQRLCGTEACDESARAVAMGLKAPNDLVVSDNVRIDFAYDCTGYPITNHSKITVRATRYKQSHLARLVGFAGGNISACATAGKFSFGGTSGIRPFALEDNCVLDLAYEQTVVIKYDSESTRDCDSTNGNYAAVAIDGSGASIYRTTIKFGSDGFVCTDTTLQCCPRLAGGCIGVYQIDTEPGNMIGPTRDGVDYLIDNTPAACDTWEEVTTEANDLVSACEPWQAGYTGATRIIIIPVVDGLWDHGGRHTVVIKNFAVLFLEGYGEHCSGSNCDIEARFIKMTATLPNSALGSAGVLSNITVVHLVN